MQEGSCMIRFIVVDRQLYPERPDRTSGGEGPMRRFLAFSMVLFLLFAFAGAEAYDPAPQWEMLYTQLNPYGIEVRSIEKSYAFDLPEGRRALSLCLTLDGDLRFGRYTQLVGTALLDAVTGEALDPETVFPDMEALQSFVNDYMEQNVQDTLNTYLDTADLLPVPLDAVCFDESGITFHYPADRYAYFSGHAGALQLDWYELEGLTRAEAPAWQFPDLLGQDIQDLLQQYGSLTDPDLLAGGEIYEFEAPALRGIQAITDGAGMTAALRTDRFNLHGVRPGMSRLQAEELLGPPETAVVLDSAAAVSLRVREGTAASYSEYCLYYDEEDLLYMVQTPSL